jgi:hypothetical protein
MHGFAKHFVDRHKHLKAEKPKKLDLSRIRASNKTHLSNFFRQVFLYYVKNGVLPGNIYNMDESSLRSDADAQTKLVGRCDGKFIIEEKESVKKFTVLFTVAANGEKLPSLFLVDESYNPMLLENSDINTVILSSKRGWMTKEIFESFFEYYLLPAIVQRIRVRLDTFYFHLFFFLSLAPPRTLVVGEILSRSCLSELNSARILQQCPQNLLPKFLTKFPLRRLFHFLHFQSKWKKGNIILMNQDLFGKSFEFCFQVCKKKSLIQQSSGRGTPLQDFLLQRRNHQQFPLPHHFRCS